MQENPAGRSSNVSVGAFDSVNVNTPDSQEVIETQVFSHASPMTPGGQQANPVSSTGVKKKRGRPRTGAGTQDLKHSKNVIIQLEIQAGGDEYPRITFQAQRQRRRKSSNPKKAT
ncbi:hypothetical protein COCSUDRAFT_52604 [Coccomyxa subellipsoidea C-169]|uniref:Uncharacterized protein n=1 Tax=Coccomyxa subellipsoidea (strain C-169) TaxID=574566 RepID=I0Z5F4_COCSC|nr:hypothetical protein COCSUDRAFT_52604 [Coccomyxa subellipsoidea C-169]EIE25873.1 hypothetical protein COCSUDRAFT_52604 [Coccomyxa subellipsoidea C-169]|eukprot:XP_005650417.1 hypothetical protein COCSUDRAFT_52604 [Coccomyxa subellipsoidea C-169]